MNNKSIYWIALFSLVLSIVTIILFFFKVKESSIVNSDTFISACTALITIGVTIAVGFQVFQSLDIKAKVNEIDHLKIQLFQAKKDLDLLTADLKSQILYNESDRKWNEGDTLNAILKLQESIEIYLRSELNKDVLINRMEILATYVSAISKRKRLNNEEIDKVLLNGFNVMWRHNTLSIKHNPNFWAISTKYK